MERDLGPLQHLQQFALSPVQARQQLTQLLVTGALPEDVVEAFGEDGRKKRASALRMKNEIAQAWSSDGPATRELAALLDLITGEA